MSVEGRAVVPPWEFCDGRLCSMHLWDVRALTSIPHLHSSQNFFFELTLTMTPCTPTKQRIIWHDMKQGIHPISIASNLGLDPSTVWQNYQKMEGPKLPGLQVRLSMETGWPCRASRSSCHYQWSHLWCYPSSEGVFQSCLPFDHLLHAVPLSWGKSVPQGKQVQ